MFTPVLSLAAEDNTSQTTSCSQGLDQYYMLEESYQSWYENLPYYQGTTINSALDSKDVATLQSNIGTSNTNIVITQNDSLSVASIYKAKLDNSQNDRFKTWKDSDFSVSLCYYM